MVSYLRDSLAHTGAQHQSELLGQILNLKLAEASKKSEWRQLATEVEISQSGGLRKSLISHS